MNFQHTLDMKRYRMRFEPSIDALSSITSGLPTGRVIDPI